MAFVGAGFGHGEGKAAFPHPGEGLLGQGLGKTTYQATTVITFFAINILKAGPYAMLGLFPAETLKVCLYLAPAALFGAWIGVKAHRMIPERPFFAITYVLLTITGTKLIFDALT